MVRKPKLLSSIRAKLFSAVAMLLVAVIMVVSSTYAWFTLSTAPEVTGMTTAIGANGSLEMALRYSNADGIEGDIQDGVLSAGVDKNTYWGNLISLTADDGSAMYGVDSITLLPSALNAASGVLGASMLQVPTYGADGRVSGLAANTTSGFFSPDNGGAFYDSTAWGFRAIGVASGMSDRQLSYRTAMQEASTAMSQAKNQATNSLNTNGSALADIAIKKGTEDDGATYTKAHLESLMAIVNDLQGTETTTGILEYIDKAYMQYMLAYVAGKAGGEDNDLKWSAVNNAVNAEGATLDSVLTSFGEQVAIPDEFSTPLAAYDQTKDDVAAAYAILNPLIEGSDTEFEWSDFSDALYKLANVDAMEINDIPAGEIMNKKTELMNSVAGGNGLVVSMKTGGGVYADVADHCGDYNASIKIEKISYDGLEFGPLEARMKTVSTITTSYLKAAYSKIQTVSPEFKGASTDAKPLTELYGYVIDMAFRTNAAQSNLLLQTEAVDRIYESNANTETAGHGSTMTFKSTSNNFTDNQVKALMGCMRVVFFAPGDTVNAGGDVLAYAKLDMSKASLGADGWTAPLCLYSLTVDTTTVYYTVEAETQTVHYVNKNGTFYAGTDTSFATPLTGDQIPTETQLEGYNTEVLTGAVTETLYGEDDAAIITALNQNQQTNVSALVYLDGTNLGNDDVAYDTAKSMTGKVNFQFASDANLVPMENGELHQPGGETPSDTPAQGGEEAGN